MIDLDFPGKRLCGYESEKEKHGRVGPGGGMKNG